MIKNIIPVYPCVAWDGTNIEEMRASFPRYTFGDNDGTLTVAGPGFFGSVQQGWFLYAQPGPTSLALSLTDPVDGPNFMLAPTSP